jgi:hypothetical protein
VPGKRCLPIETHSSLNNFTLLGGHVDGLLAASAPQRNGYNYTLLEATAATYTIVAQPVTPGQTGIESFIITEAGTIEPLSLNVAAQLGLVNLADNFDRLDSTEVSRTYIGGSELTSDHWRLGGYEFKNLLDRAVELIIAIKNPTYGGGILAAGATLIGDGTLDESSSDDTKVDYYHLGEVGAGESLNMNEYLQLNNYDNSGGWYSRSIQAYEYNGLNVLEPVGGLTGGTNVTA